MHKEENSISVQEMIKRYHQELMEFQKKHASQSKPDAPVAEDRLDADFPLPDVTSDLEALRRLKTDAPENTVAVMAQTQQNSDRPLELEPGQMEPPPGFELPRGTLFIRPSDKATGSEGPNTTEPADPAAGVPAFPTSPTLEEIAPTIQRDMSLGYLRVAVTTGRGTIPVPDAQVIATRLVNGNEVLEQSDRTNNSGITPLFTLPAVSSIYSQSPGNGNPYTYYTIYVRANGFYPIKLVNVPLYGGVTSIQPVELIPVAEGGNPDQENTITEGAPENLQ